MLYLAFFYCHGCSDSRHVNPFDCENRKPCIGTCGHSICMECVYRNPSGTCPICQRDRAFIERTINYSSLQMIEYCSENYWELMNNWWSGTGFGEGSCSKCSKQTQFLRICFTCDRNNLCEWETNFWRLRMRNDNHLLNLATHSICSDCVFNHHSTHKSVKIQNIKFAEEDIRMTTSKIILELFRNRMENKKGAINCKLRHMRIELTGRPLWKLFKETVNSKNGECGWLFEQIKTELIKKGVDNLNRQLKDYFNDSKKEQSDCECVRLSEMMRENGSSEYDTDYKFGVMAARCRGSDQLGCPLYFDVNSEDHMKMLLIGEENCSTQQLIRTENYETSCPLCVLLGFRKRTPERIDFYRNNCVEIYETWWKSEMPSLETVCLRCLKHLNRFNVGISCKNRKKKERKYVLKRYHWAQTLEGRNGRFRRYIEDKYNESDRCRTENCYLKNPNNWKYEIKCETESYARSILEKGIEEVQGFVDCHLRRMRMLNSYYKLIRCIFEFSMENLSKWSASELSENCTKVDELLESLKDQWEEFRFGSEEDSERVPRGSKCKCKLLWEQHGEKLKKSFSSIAEYSPMIVTKGCPLTFDHGVIIEY